MPLTVMLVEDTRTITALLKIYLLHLGCDFLEASNGDEALSLALTRRPDLVISDVSMPVMDGFALCAALKSDPGFADVPVLLPTSHGDELSRRKGRLVGADAFLTKPVSVVELRQVVDAALAARGAR